MLFFACILSSGVLRGLIYGKTFDSFCVSRCFVINFGLVWKRQRKFVFSPCLERLK